MCIDFSLATFSPHPSTLPLHHPLPCPLPTPFPLLLPHSLPHSLPHHSIPHHCFPTTASLTPLNGGQVTSNSDEGSDSSVSDGAPLGHFSLEPSVPEREEERRRRTKRRKPKGKRSSVHQIPKMKMAHSEGVCTYIRTSVVCWVWVYSRTKMYVYIRIYICVYVRICM